MEPSRTSCSAPSPCSATLTRTVSRWRPGFARRSTARRRQGASTLQICPCARRATRWTTPKSLPTTSAHCASHRRADRTLMLSSSARIVRVMSASWADTDRVERARGRSGYSRPSRPAATSQSRTGRQAPPPQPTPVPAAELVAHAVDLRALLRELAEVTGCENAWGLRVLKRNVELALASPETLERAENQIDFIEELAEAVWDGADSGFRYAVTPAATPDATRARELRRQAIVDRFDELADRLCKQVERWQALEPDAAGTSLSAPWPRPSG